MPRPVFRPRKLKLAGPNHSGKLIIVTNTSEMYGVNFTHHYFFLAEPPAIRALVEHIASRVSEASDLVSKVTSSMVKASEVGTALGSVLEVDLFSTCYHSNVSLRPGFPSDMSLDTYPGPKHRDYAELLAHDLIVANAYANRFRQQRELERHRN